MRAGKTVINSFDWHVSRDGDGHADGYFKAKGTPPSVYRAKTQHGL
jgi:hypothetical protein